MITQHILVSKIEEIISDAKNKYNSNLVLANEIVNQLNKLFVENLNLNPILDKNFIRKEIQNLFPVEFASSLNSYTVNDIVKKVVKTKTFKVWKYQSIIKNFGFVFHKPEWWVFKTRGDNVYNHKNRDVDTTFVIYKFINLHKKEILNLTARYNLMQSMQYNVNTNTLGDITIHFTEDKVSKNKFIIEAKAPKKPRNVITSEQAICALKNTFEHFPFVESVCFSGYYEQLIVTIKQNYLENPNNEIKTVDQNICAKSPMDFLPEYSNGERGIDEAIKSINKSIIRVSNDMKAKKELHEKAMNELEKQIDTMVENVKILKSAKMILENQVHTIEI